MAISTPDEIASTPSEDMDVFFFQQREKWHEEEGHTKKMEMKQYGALPWMISYKKVWRDKEGNDVTYKSGL